MSKGDAVMVVVRVRPLSRREIDMNTEVCIDMKGKQVLLAAANKQQQKNYSFDHCFWSIDPGNPKFTGQVDVFNALGENFLKNSFQGYNGCVFAYGQTGSGKSYTMMGPPSGEEERGLIPRLCDALFSRIETQAADRPDIASTVEVSYMEIYNERVRDLLMPRGQKELRVREHHSLGPYVEGLTKLATSTSAEIERLMLEGNRSRTVAATQMNSESSRSHAVFTIEFRQTEFDAVRGLGTEKVSRISLVDLAGSERASKTGTTGDRLKEGSNINLALTTLGRVISALADISSGKKTQDFVPYRDSVLTWLLKDSLGGNSRTIMIATISPSRDNFEETLSTLRYADRAKRIVNHAVINEDDNSRIIRELKEELARLKDMLDTGGGPGAREVPAGDEELAEKLLDAQNMLTQREQSWGEKLDNTRRLEEERQKVMEEMGISIQSAGIQVKSGHFYLVNMNADPSMNELLVYNVKETTLVGRPDNVPAPDIQLKGLNIQKQHCKIQIIGVECTITPFEGAVVYVNGKEITESTRLYHGYRILLGNNHWFRVNAPGGHANCPEGDSQDEVDISSAKKELAMNDYESIVSDMKEEKEEALKKLQEDYEQQLVEVRERLSDYLVSNNTTPDNQSYHSPSELEASSLTRLQELVLYATDLVRTANQYSEALQRDVRFSVTLRIVPSYLAPRSRYVTREDIMGCVAIRVIFPGKGSDAVWTIEMLQDKLAVIAEMYEEAERNREERGEGANIWKDSMGPDPFCDVEDHSLIGVANAYLNCLFHFLPVEYSVPVLSPQGKIIGKINLTLQRLNSVTNEFDHFDDFDIPISTGSSYTGSSASALQDLLPGSTIYIRVKIQSAEDLPPNIQFVFLQYRLFGFDVPTTVAPVTDFVHQDSVTDGYFSYQHMKTYGIEVSEDFTDYCREGVLSIEVYGHRTTAIDSPGFSQSIENNPEKKWIRVRNYVSMTAKILELNVEGDYSPVELKDTAQSPSGGIYPLKQGQSRKIQISVQNVQSSGSIELGSIQSVEIGSVIVRSKQDVPMDSYQEQDFNLMKEKWGHTLHLRKEYLDNEMKQIMDKEQKTSEDINKETKLIDEWLMMQQERNLIVHSDFNQILGMSRNWNLPLGFEFRVPIIFINIEEDIVYKTGAILGENDEQMIPLKFKPEAASKLEVISNWDSSDHENKHLMGITAAKDRVFIILRITVALKHPPGCKIRLRKRLNIRIVKNRGGFLSNFGFGKEPVRKSGVVFEIFCGLPRTEGVPIRVDVHPSILEPNTGESIVQTFRRGMEEISNQLQLDRLRQEISLKEQLNKSGVAHLAAPRSVSPGIHSGISSSPRSAEDSESPDLDPIPGIVVSPPIHRPAKQTAILPHSISDTNLFTPPQSMSPVEPTNPMQNNEITPTPNSTTHAPMLLVQEPSVADHSNDSPAVEKELPPFNTTIEEMYAKTVKKFDLDLDTRMFPPQTRPEDLLTPDLSPNDSFSQEFSGSVSPENYESTLPQIPETKQRSPLSQKYSAPVRKPDPRRSTPMRSSTPDLGGKKRDPQHRMSTPSRNPVEVDFKLNDFVLVELKVGSKVAKVRYIGPFHPAKEEGIWVGLELSEPTGKHNGTVESKVYFKCREKHGSFVPLSKVISVCSERVRPASSTGTRMRRTGTPLSASSGVKLRGKF